MPVTREPSSVAEGNLSHFPMTSHQRQNVRGFANWWFHSFHLTKIYLKITNQLGVLVSESRSYSIWVFSRHQYRNDACLKLARKWNRMMVNNRFIEIDSWILVFDRRPFSPNCWATSTRHWTTLDVPTGVILVSDCFTASLTWPAGPTKRSPLKIWSSPSSMAKANAAESLPPSEWHAASAITTCGLPIPTSSSNLSSLRSQRWDFPQSVFCTREGREGEVKFYDTELSSVLRSNVLELWLELEFWYNPSTAKKYKESTRKVSSRLTREQ